MTTLPMHLAALQGVVYLVIMAGWVILRIFYLDPNGKVETTSKNKTLQDSILQFSTKCSSVECVAELLEFDIDVNFLDGIGGQTSLHMACKDDKLKVVRLLLKKNAGLFFTVIIIIV